MAYYYVRDHADGTGTATGDGGRYTSQKTGDWDTAFSATTEYYASISAALGATTAPAAGDYILVSDIHSHSYGTSGQTFIGIDGATFAIIAVDDTNCENARRSGNRAAEQVTGTSADFTFANKLIMSGLEFSTEDNITVSVAPSGTVAIDCKFIITGSADKFALDGDGKCMRLVDCEIALNNNNASIDISNGVKLFMLGGSITSSTGTMNDMINGDGHSGGAFAEFIGVDLSEANGNVVGNMGGSSTHDDTIDIKFHRCKMHASATFVEDTLQSECHRIIFTQCSSSSSVAEYQYLLKTYTGDVEDESTIRRADDEAFTSSATDISYKITTNATCNAFNPLWFDFPIARYAELSSASTDTLRFYCATNASTLKDNEIWAEVIYPDGTNKHTPNFATSAPTANANAIDLMAAGSTLTTDSGSDWRDGASALSAHNEYYFEVSTSGDAGADTVPFVRIYVAKASATIYLASEYSLN